MEINNAVKIAWLKYEATSNQTVELTLPIWFSRAIMSKCFNHTIQNTTTAVSYRLWSVGLNTTTTIKSYCENNNSCYKYGFILIGF